MAPNAPSAQSAAAKGEVVRRQAKMHQVMHHRKVSKSHFMVQEGSSQNSCQEEVVSGHFLSTGVDLLLY